MTDRQIFRVIAATMTAICLALLAVVVYAAATARADSSCTSTRNGWTYDRCTGVVTAGPGAWVKPGSDQPFVVTLWRRDVHGGPQTRASRVSVPDLGGFPTTIGTAGDGWCGLQWDVTRGGTWLAGEQIQWPCPTATPTGTETTWTSTPTSTPTASTTSTAPGPTPSTTASTPSTSTTMTTATPTSSQPGQTESEPAKPTGTHTSSHRPTSASSTMPAPSRSPAPAATLPETGDGWQFLGVLVAPGFIVVGAAMVRTGKRGRYRS